MKTRIIKSGRFFEIAITTDPSGRTSIVVHDNKYPYEQKPLVDIELSARAGKFKDAFKSIVKIAKDVEISQEPPKTVDELYNEWREAYKNAYGHYPDEVKEP